MTLKEEPEAYLDDSFMSLLRREPDVHFTYNPQKVSIIGCGDVGSAIAYAMCLKDICPEIAMYDNNEQRLDAVLEDLQQAAVLSSTDVYGAATPEVTAESKVVIVAAGCRGKLGKSPSLAENVILFKELIPILKETSPNAVYIIVTDPVEIMSYFAAQFGGFPLERVIGIGTTLESAQLRHVIANNLGVHPESVQASVYGMQDEWPIPDWPGVQVGGVPQLDIDLYLKQRSDDDPAFMPLELSGSKKLIVQNKGYVSWSVALGVVEMCNAVLRNTLQVLPASTYVKGKTAEGRDMDTFLSLPCVIGEGGVIATVNLQTTLESREAFFRAARRVHFSLEYINQIFGEML